MKLNIFLKNSNVVLIETLLKRYYNQEKGVYIIWGEDACEVSILYNVSSGI